MRENNKDYTLAVWTYKIRSAWKYMKMKNKELTTKCKFPDKCTKHICVFDTNSGKVCCRRKNFPYINVKIYPLQSVLKPSSKIRRKLFTSL